MKKELIDFLLLSTIEVENTPRGFLDNGLDKPNLEDIYIFADTLEEVAAAIRTNDEQTVKKIVSQLKELYPLSDYKRMEIVNKILKKYKMNG